VYRNGIFASDIVIMTPPVILISDNLQIEKIDYASQVYLLGSTLDKVV